MCANIAGPSGEQQDESSASEVSAAERAPLEDGVGASAAGAGVKRTRDPLLAGICHDLRAPLAAVTMGTNFVAQTMPQDETTARSRRVLAAVLRSCKQMERLVRDFGDLSRVEANAVELHPGVHDAAEIVTLAAEAARAQAAERKVTIATRSGGQLLVACDRDLILRALGAIVENAVRFSPEAAEVVVEVTDESADSGPSEIRFSVTDQGPGIAEETLRHLYDRPWHVKRPDRSGAGMGLAIARGLARAHGGRLEVDTKPGGPTTVSIVLPRELASRAAASAH